MTAVEDTLKKNNDEKKVPKWNKHVSYSSIDNSNIALIKILRIKIYYKL